MPSQSLRLSDRTPSSSLLQGQVPRREGEKESERGRVRLREKEGVRGREREKGCKTEGDEAKEIKKSD
jgi:hypothetical protein